MGKREPKAATPRRALAAAFEAAANKSTLEITNRHMPFACPKTPLSILTSIKININQENIS
jgi:hypothetical protein